MSFLSLDRSQNDSCLTVFLTEGKRVFHISILYLVRLGNGYASGRLSYGQASAYRPRHMHYVTVLVFVCPYVRTTLESADSSNSCYLSTRLICFRSVAQALYSYQPTSFFVINSSCIWALTLACASMRTRNNSLSSDMAKR